MGDQDARPPPGVCDLVRQVLRNSESRDLRAFSEDRPDDFVLLLHHADTCHTCRLAIDQAFPGGFVTEEEARQLTDGLNEAEQLLIRDKAERDSSQDSPETGGLDTEPRGGG